MKKHHSPVEYVSPKKRQRTDTNSRNNERQQIQENSSHVCCWMDYESIESMEYLPPPRTTHVSPKSSTSLMRPQIASSTISEIFLDRLHKEIVVPFRFTLSSQIQLLDSDQSVYDATERRNEIQKRLLFGYNNVSKFLFDANIGKVTKPLLVVVVLPGHEIQTESQLPPHYHASTIGAAMLQHVPLLAYEMNIPLLLLPSLYSTTTENQTRAKCDTTQALATIFGYGNKSNHHFQHLSCIAFTQNMMLATTTTTTTTTTGDDPLDDASEQQHNHIHNTVDSFVNYIIGKMQI